MSSRSKPPQPGSVCNSPPGDAFSVLLSWLVCAFCAYKKLPIAEFGRRVRARTPSTYRRICNGQSVCNSDVAIAIVFHIADELNLPWVEVLRQLLRPDPRADDPLVQLMHAQFWHPYRRRVGVPLALIRRHLEAQDSLTALEGGFPPYLLPPRLTTALLPAPAAAESALARRMHEALMKRLGEKTTEASVFFPREAVLSLTSGKGPFATWPDADRRELAEHVVQDWIRERGLHVGLYDAGRKDFPPDLSLLVSGSASVLAVGDALVFERPVGESVRRWYERAANAVTARYVDFQLARLDAMREWVRHTSPPNEAEALLVPLLPRRAAG